MPLLRAPDTSCESSQRAHAISTDVLAPDPEGRGAASAPLGLAHHPPQCSWSLFKAALVPLIKRSSASRCWSHREHPGVAMVAPVRAPKVPVCLSPSVLRTEASPAEAQWWPAESRAGTSHAVRAAPVLPSEPRCCRWGARAAREPIQFCSLGSGTPRVGTWGVQH